MISSQPLILQKLKQNAWTCKLREWLLPNQLNCLSLFLLLGRSLANPPDNLRKDIWNALGRLSPVNNGHSSEVLFNECSSIGKVAFARHYWQQSPQTYSQRMLLSFQRMKGLHGTCWLILRYWADFLFCIQTVFWYIPKSLGLPLFLVQCKFP